MKKGSGIYIDVVWHVITTAKSHEGQKKGLSKINIGQHKIALGYLKYRKIAKLSA